MHSRVLLTGPALSSKSSLDFELPSSDRDTDFIPEEMNPEVLGRIAHDEFDGVVCKADGPEALDLVCKIRTTNSRVPIVLVSARLDSEFENRALSSGASFVIAGNLHRDVVAETVALLKKLNQAARVLEGRGKANKTLQKELQAAVLESRAISRYGDQLRRHRHRRDLLPLLVENDPAEALAFMKAFEKAEIFAPLPILKSPQEALSYLQGTPPYEDRNRYPLPNTILIDLLPLSIGVTLIRWIRQQPELLAIPIIALSASAKPEEIQAFYGNLASSFLLKPSDFDHLVSLVQSIDLYWTRMNIGRSS